MIRNTEKQHLKSIICSLNKSFIQATIHGKLKSSQIYMLNTIYNLLTKCENSMSTNNINKLSLLYNNVFYSCPQICKEYVVKSTSTFTQNNSDNTLTSKTFIHYWQETDYFTTFEDIKTLIENPIYYGLKPHDSYNVFNIGKTISYTNIGKTCFLLKNTLLLNEYSIYDILDNDVTESFLKHYDTINSNTLFVSKNIYAHGNILFKIKNTN